MNKIHERIGSHFKINSQLHFKIKAETSDKLKSLNKDTKQLQCNTNSWADKNYYSIYKVSLDYHIDIQ